MSRPHGSGSTPRSFYARRVQFRGEQSRGSGWLTNVSQTGAFVHTHRAPQVGESVRVELADDPRDPVVLEGPVRWRGRRSDAVDGFKLDVLEASDGYYHFVHHVERDGDEGVDPVAQRVPAVIPVVVESDRTADSGIIRDISMTGAQLTDTRVRPRVGAPIRLSLVIPGRLGALEIPALVVRVSRAGAYAVHFQVPDEASRDVLGRLIHHCGEAL